MRSLEHRFDLAPLIARDLQLQMTFLKYPRFVPIDERYGDLAMRRWQWAFYQKNPTYVPEGITEQTVFGQTREKWIDDALYSTFVTWCPGHLQLKHARAFDNTLALYDELADPAITPQRLIDIASGQDSDDVFFVHTATVGTFQQVRAHTQATIAALEVERFRLREGRWPTGLGEVFDEVPQCAYGHPLHMKRIGHEVRVYSIGENGIDEDGNGPASPHDYEAEDDWGIILLDPDQRGRPATED